MGIMDFAKKSIIKAIYRRKICNCDIFLHIIEIGFESRLVSNQIIRPINKMIMRYSILHPIHNCKLMHWTNL